MVGGWRWAIARQKRPTPPNPQSLIVPPDSTDRFLGFESVANLRDIGGYRTANGQRVKWGQVYRGASLAYVAPNERDKLDALGLQVVCDLRRPDEIEKAPNQLPQGANYLNVPSMDTINSFEQVRQMLFKPHYLEVMMAEIYIEAIIENNPNMFRAVYQQIIDGKLPLLVHCTAGKDRTGLAVALLLLLLGVDEDTVLNDYTLSNHYFDYFKRVTGKLVKWLKRVGFTEADVSPLLMADRRNLKTALEHIKRKYGSVEAYLIARAEMTPQDFEALKARLLE